MKPRIIVSIFLISFFSCTHGKREPKGSPLNQQQIEQIKSFASEMAVSINQYQYDFVRSAWDKNAFKERVSELNKTEQTVFNHFYDKELSEGFMNINIDLINKLKFNHGKIALTNMRIFENYGEATFSMIFDYGIDFWKYRIELRNETPRLTDFYSFRDEIWQSQNIKNVIRLNSKYTAVSKERQEANRSLLNSERALLRRDSLAALEYLYEIPETHLIGNSLSIKKINLAHAIHDSIFAQVLTSEFETNQSIYMQYLYGYFFRDTVLLNKVFGELEKEVGASNTVLDSLKTLNYLWK